jgi:competence protein ComEC
LVIFGLLLFSLFLHIVKMGSSSTALILLSFMVSGFFVHELSMMKIHPISPRKVKVVGWVVSPPELRRRELHFILKPEKITTYEEPFFLRGLLLIKTSYKNPIPSYGEKIKVFGKLYTPKQQSFLRFLATKGVSAVLIGERLKIFPGEKRGNPITKIAIRTKHIMKDIIDTTIPQPGGDLLKGMVLGERWALSPFLREAFYQIGVGHILAVSGLHVGFILFGSLWLLRLFRLGRKRSMCISILIIAFYVLITGCKPSSIRAFIMASFSILAYLLDRDHSLLNGLTTAAFLILCFRPLYLFNVGFQLSFAATLGIILFFPLIKETLNRLLPEWLSIALSVSFAAQLSVWPILAYHFETFSPIAPFANIIIVPLAGLSVGLGFVGFIASGISFEMSEIIGKLNGFILDGLCDFAHLLALFPFSSIMVSKPHPLFIIGYYILVFGVRYFVGRRRGWNL